MQPVRENTGRRRLFQADTYLRYDPIAEPIGGCYLEPVRPIFGLVPREYWE
jgi:hypothetical protein